MLRIRLVGALAGGLMLSFVVAGTARAQVTHSIWGFGGATDSVRRPVGSIISHQGTIGMTGQFTTIGARNSAVNIVVTYQDSDDPEDGITCIFKGPSSLSIAGGVLRLTVYTGDSCFETLNNNPLTTANYGKSISFYYFPGSAATGGNRFVGKSVNLVDADNDDIEDQTVVGTVQP